MKTRHEQKLVILTILLLIELNLPILLLFDNVQSIIGIPVIYVYIFSCWLLSVLISYFIIKRYYE